MFETVRLLAPTEGAALCRFYQEVCEHQAQDAYSADWHWGVYPSRESLLAELQHGQFLVGIQDGRIAAAGRLTVGEDADYLGTPWTKAVPNDQIAVLHLFAVHPDYRGTGAGTAMLTALQQQAALQGQRVMHLDVMVGNAPAEKLYQRCGFTLAADQTLHYQDIGDTAARLYECQLSEA